MYLAVARSKDAAILARHCPFDRPVESSCESTLAVRDARRAFVGCGVIHVEGRVAGDEQPRVDVLPFVAVWVSSMTRPLAGGVVVRGMGGLCVKWTLSTGACEGDRQVFLAHRRGRASVRVGEWGPVWHECLWGVSGHRVRVCAVRAACWVVRRLVVLGPAVCDQPSYCNSTDMSQSSRRLTRHGSCAGRIKHC